MEVTCSTIDDFMSLVLLTCRAPDAILGYIFVSDEIYGSSRRLHVRRQMTSCHFALRTCHAPDCHTGAYFPFQMRFMDLHLCHMFDDRWFYVARFLTCHTFDAILGHITVLDEIYRSWWSCALIPICETYIETIIYSLSLGWFLSGAFLELPSQGCTPTLRCHHAFLPRDAPLIYGSDSVVDMDDLDRADLSSSDFPTYHIWMPHRSVFPILFEICRSPTDLHDQDSCPIHVF